MKDRIAQNGFCPSLRVTLRGSAPTRLPLTSISRQLWRVLWIDSAEEGLIRVRRLLLPVISQ